MAKGTLEPQVQSLVDLVLSGSNREVQRLAASGLLPLAPEDLIPLQVRMAQGTDAELADLAHGALANLEPWLVSRYLADLAPREVLDYFAAGSQHPVILEAILRRRDVPSGVLVQLARRLAPDLQEVLLLRQDIIVEEPQVLDALAENPNLSSFCRRRIAEYREHLLPRAPARETAEEETAAEAVADEELEAALAAAREEPADGEVEETTGLSEIQIRSLPVPIRMRLTRGAPRTLRNILVRDSNPMVAVSVLTNNVLSDQEVEQIASSRVVVEEVLAEIGRRREWSSKYSVVCALVRNPRTPTGMSVRLIPRLAIRDLRDVSRDRNIPEAVRSTAARLYKIKSR